MKELTINHAAVWVCVVLLHGLGFVWYGSLFAEPWMAMVGLDLATVEANPPGASVWVTNTVATVVPVYFLAWLFTKLNVESAMRGATLAFGISFSFVFLTRMTSDMFSQNPYALSWIVGGFSVVALVISGLVLGGWRKYKAEA